MTVNLSNTAYLTVLPPRPLDGLGWTLRVLSERDYSSPVALVERFAGLGFTVDANAPGGGTVSLDSDDAVFSGPLPAGESTRLVDQEALWQVLEDGQVRFEFLAEDVEEDVIPAGGGPRQTVIAGRGTGSVLEWAPVLPDGFPTAVSSMTLERVAHPMQVFTSLLTGAQAAGYLPFVSRSFDSVTDSRGVPWGPAQALTVNAGDNLLDLLTRWAESCELSWRMLPGFVLEVVQDGGARLEDSVVFTQYRSQGGHKRKISRRELANVVYADSGDLGLAVAEDSGSVLKWRKRGAWVSAGDSGDASARSAVANISLSLSKDQRQSRTIALIPDREGRHPFVDFGVSDWVGVEVPDDDADSGAVRIMGLAVDIDADGVVKYEATLQSKFEGRAVKMARLLDKLGGSERSGAGGAAASPIPVSKALSAVKLADLSDVDLTAPAPGALLQFSGGRWVDVTANLDFLADVDAGTIPDSGTVGLLYDRAAGLWSPAVLPSGGSGGSGGSGAVTVAVLAGDVSGSDSGSGYAGASTVLTVRSALKLTGLDFYAVEAGTYTLKIDGVVMGAPVAVVAAGLIQFTFPEVVLTVGSHPVGVTGAGAKKVRYRGAASVLYLGAGYDFTAAGWSEGPAGAYTVPFVYRGSGEIAPALGSILSHVKFGSGTDTAVGSTAGPVAAALAPELAFTLTAATMVEVSAPAVWIYSSGAPFCWQLSNDNWATNTLLDPYTALTGSYSTYVLQRMRYQQASAAWNTSPGPSALLNLPAGSWKVRLYKTTTTAATMAANAGYALARKV